MTEFRYSDVKQFISGLKEKNFAPVYLIYGEEFLYKSVFEELLSALLPGSNRGMNYEPFEGDSDIREVIERLNTFSFMGGAKVVAMTGARVFDSRQDAEAILKKAREHFEKGESRKAARVFVSVLSHMSLSFRDVGPENRKGLKSETLKSDKETWVDGLSEYCQANRIKIPAAADSGKILEDALEKGFAKGNHLIITCDAADKRRTLYKAIKKVGVIVDCSAPKGDRKADRDTQQALLRECMNNLLGRMKKKMDPAAFAAMSEMTGFDLRTFSGNLEKLVSYVGERENITRKDVDAVLKRTKKDPIYELSGAIADRNLQQALQFAGTLLSDGLHPLQILATVVNQIRRLLVVKDFTTSPAGRASWRPGCQYNQFQSQVMPKIVEYDRQIEEQIAGWDEALTAVEENGKKKGKKKKKTVSDIRVAKNPRSPYPVYLTLVKSEKFTVPELTGALSILAAADMRLKSSATSPRLVLENAIIRICRGDQVA